jgi:hypothetical protein
MSARQSIATLSVMILLVATLAGSALAQTEVFVNWSELSVGEALQIQRCMPVIADNYWMDAQGTLGYVERGPNRPI